MGDLFSNVEDLALESVTLPYSCLLRPQWQDMRSVMAVASMYETPGTCDSAVVTAPTGCDLKCHQRKGHSRAYLTQERPKFE